MWKTPADRVLSPVQLGEERLSDYDSTTNLYPSQSRDVNFLLC